MKPITIAAVDTSRAPPSKWIDDICRALSGRQAISKDCARRNAQRNHLAPTSHINAPIFYPLKLLSSLKAIIIFVKHLTNVLSTTEYLVSMKSHICNLLARQWFFDSRIIQVPCCYYISRQQWAKHKLATVFK